MAKGSKYTEEFWKQVKVLADKGMTPSQVARWMGVNTNKFLCALRWSGKGEEWFKKHLRPHRYLRIEGVVDTIKGHCDRYGLNYSTLMYKERRGDSLEKLFGRPVQVVDISVYKAEKAA